MKSRGRSSRSDPVRSLATRHPEFESSAHLQGIEPVSDRAYSNFRGSRREGVGCRCATRFRVTNRDFEHRKCRSATMHSSFKARRVTFHE
jgi:hypothetical protein